jgi:RecB family exonuclease
MKRRTVVVEGPLAFRMRRLAAARSSEAGLQIMTLPLLAARLAGGFSRPARSEDLEPAIRSALDRGDFVELEGMRQLPGMTRSVAWTLGKAWDADISLSDFAAGSSRIADLASIQHRVRAALPAGVLTPRDLRDAALNRVEHAGAVLGTVELDHVLNVAPVWRPLLDALARAVDLRWCDPGGANHASFPGKVVAEAVPPRSPIEVVSCANPHTEVVESLRWVRELLASGRARPEEIAIAATSTGGWDEHFLVLAADAALPVHFSHGVPALSTREGQACAALADVLLNGLSQDRMRRLLGHAAGRSGALKELPRNWATGIRPGAGLFEMDHWHRALDDAAARRPEGLDPKPILMPVVELLANGPAIAEQAGEMVLGPAANALWIEALRRAPAEALEFSLQALRVPDGRDPGASIAWCPASHLAGAPRPWIRLLGLTSRSWPRSAAEDPLLPNHILPRHKLDPEPITVRDRRAFEVITRRASGGCVLSRSRRDAQGKFLAASPLLGQSSSTVVLKRGRTPRHAFSEADRLAARPQDAAVSPAIAAATACWADWREPAVTPHDGRVRPEHPIVRRAVAEIQSATSLRLMLRDPLAFIWRYALGWRSTVEDDQPLSLDARSFGELVHELLKQTVDALEPHPGYARAARHEIEDALAAAVAMTGIRWPLERSTPPPLLWRHTLDAGAGLALKALTLDEAFRPGTRSWTEVAFGRGGDDPGDADLPWDPRSAVRIAGTNVRVRGAIDRLDLNATGDAVRVSDYKTGAEPKNADRIVLGGGAELQRAIYALAASQLLSDTPRVVARLVFLGEDSPRAYRLTDVDAAIGEMATHVAAACALLDRGTALPGLDARERWNEFRLALPAAAATYFQVKQSAFGRALGGFSSVWSCR